MMRIALFLATNLAVLVLLGVILFVLENFFGVRLGNNAQLGQRLGFVDADGDGYGTVLERSCDPTLAARGGDCADGDASVSPAALEACNGRDDDCDGRVDEADRRFDFGLWRQEGSGQPWAGLVTIRDSDTEEVRATLEGFTKFAVAGN